KCRDQEPDGDGKRAEVRQVRMLADPGQQALARASTRAELALEAFEASIDEVVADVLLRRRPVLLNGLASHGDGPARHGRLVGPGATRDLLDGATITVAGGKILQRMHPGGIAAQDRLDAAQSLEEVVPIKR